MAPGGRFDAILFALGNRDYRIYTAGNICSHFGMWAYRIALQWLTWKLTGSAFWLRHRDGRSISDSVLGTDCRRNH